MIVSYSGKIEGSDSHGKGLHKILYQAYHMLKKVKSVDMLTCQHVNIFKSVVFSHQKKHLLCVGWRNFFSSCAVGSVFWFLVGNRF